MTGITAQVALSLLGHRRKTARLAEEHQYDAEDVRERLERKMRALGLLDRPDSAGAGEGVV